MKIEKLPVNIRPSNSDTVRLKETGDILEVLGPLRCSRGGYITKIDKDHYLDNRTGEVLEFQHIENRSQDLKSVARSLARLRDYINTNVFDVSCCRWLTFTYADNMTDPNKLKRDFNHCVERLRDSFGDFEYITAAEPQGRGAWHLHSIFIFDHKAPYMANDVVSKAWKRGFVTVKRLDNVDNVGAYLTAYLGDMDLNEYVTLDNVPDHIIIKDVDFEDEDGNRQKKRYVKGGRLYMYPSGFNIFRCSKGIKKPVVTMMSNEQAEKKVSAATLTFEKTVALSDPDKEFESTLNYRYYNRKRKKTQ